MEESVAPERVVPAIVVREMTHARGRSLGANAAPKIDAAVRRRLVALVTRAAREAGSRKVVGASAIRAAVQESGLGRGAIASSVVALASARRSRQHRRTGKSQKATRAEDSR
jgi:hypothetical protein